MRSFSFVSPADLAPFVLAVVGAGPRGVGVLERIGANAGELLGARRLVVHLIDPFPAGAGRVWRYEQSPLLRMNSMPVDVTVFTDDTVEIDGPIRPGPSLIEWARLVRTGALDAEIDDSLWEELASLESDHFPTRRLQSAYLAWFHRKVRAELPDGIEVVEHRTRAVRLEAGEPQSLWLENQTDPLKVDAVLFTVGHLDSEPDERESELAKFAERGGLAYYRAGYTADVDYSAIAPGETVLVRGFGLAFVDLMLLLTEGRGGRFEEQSGGGLKYRPSGDEPILHIGSRRGVPYHAKIGYQLRGKPLRLPRFFDTYAIERLCAAPGLLEFRADVWPLIAKELAWGYYSELFTAHPDRVSMDFAVFADAFADSAPGDLAALVAEAVPLPEDRLDLERLDRPMEGIRFGSAEEYGKELREYIEADLGRRANSVYSADLGAFNALLTVLRQLPVLLRTGKLDGYSKLSDLDGWFLGFFSYFASGPPPRRLEELLALHEAGLVSFLGGEMRVKADEERQVFLASGANFPGETEARTLVEARLPQPSITRASDVLLRQLRDSGALGEETVIEVATGDRLPTGRIHTRVSDNRLLDGEGRPHWSRFALGPHTSTRSSAAFTRPMTNALPFRQNDFVAREILRLAAEG